MFVNVRSDARASAVRGIAWLAAADESDCFLLATRRCCTIQPL
jgi:hypothetical protein